MEALLRRKGDKGSFTEVILRLTAERPSLSKFSGRWVGDFEELERALAELEGMWRAFGKEVEGVLQQFPNS
jgi:predicted CopG family antitoxin